MTPVKMFELKEKENKNQRLKQYSSKFLFVVIITTYNVKVITSLSKCC